MTALSGIILGTMYIFLSANVKAQEPESSTPTTTTTSESERPYYPRMEFGIRFMPTVSAFDMKTYSGGTVKGEATLGFGIGGMLAFNVSRHVGIQTELIYNSLSQKFKDQDLNHEIKVRYFNVPLLLTLNTNIGNPVNINLVMGPQLGINMGSSISTSGGSGSSSDTLTTVFALKNSDFGIAYGGGLDFLLNTTKTIRLDVGFRGVYGIANISNTRQNTGNDSY